MNNTENKNEVVKNEAAAKKSWFEGLDYNAGDILYLKPDKKFGKFQSFGKRADRLWTTMFKKNTLDPMSRDWALIKDETEIAFKLINGEFVNQNPAKFVMKDKIPMLVEEIEKAEKVKTVQPKEQKTAKPKQNPKNSKSKDTQSNKDDKKGKAQIIDTFKKEENTINLTNETETAAITAMMDILA